MKFVLRVADDAVALATCGPFVIVIWRGVPTRARLEAGLALMEEHAAAIGPPIGVISVVEEGSPPPSTEDMVFIQSSFGMMSRVIAAMAGVFETTGELEEARVAREMIGGAMGRRVELKQCFAVEEACTWIVPRIVPGAERPYGRALARTIEKIRACITAPPRAKRRAAARR